MKRCILIGVGMLIGLSSLSWCAKSVMAQEPTPTPLTRQVAAPTPIIQLPPCPGCREDVLHVIVDLNIREGLKQFLIADLNARYGNVDEAKKILKKQLGVEEDPEIVRLLEYLQQQVEAIERSLPIPIPKLSEDIKRRADAEYQNSLYQKKHGKSEEAIQIALEALQLYQQIENIEGQLLVRYQLAGLYKETGNNAEALWQAEQFMELEQQLELVKKVEEMQELLEE